MTALLVIPAIVAALGLSMSVRVLQQYGEGVVVRLGRVVSVKRRALASIDLKGIQPLDGIKLATAVNRCERQRR